MRKFVVKQYVEDGPKSTEMVYRDFEAQVRDLLKRADRRQVRRSQISDMHWPTPITPGYAGAFGSFDLAMKA